MPLSEILVNILNVSFMKFLCNAVCCVKIKIAWANNISMYRLWG